MPFSYANPLSGPSAGSIGWFNFENLTINPGQTVTGLTGTLSDGTTITFDMSLALVSGQPRTFVASPVPTLPGAFFGTAGYTGIAGNVALYSNFNYAGTGVNTFTISNIVVKDAGGNPISNYTAILSDSETTNLDEVWTWQTNGGVWNLLATVGSNPPILTGIGTQTAAISSTTLFPQVTQAAYVLTTQSPTQLIVASTESQSGRQAFSLGFATTRVRLQKNVGGRIDPSDQFVLDIAGSPASQVTTTGTADGIQSVVADVFAIPGNAYIISEAIAPGSASALSDYTQFTSASNSSIGGSIPPTGMLPITFIPALGDDVLYTILNAAPETFVKSVDKVFATASDILTYTVSVENPNNFALSNVLVTDTTPLGTTYIGNLIVSAPYTGTDPASGITITTIAPNSTVVLSWQVQVDSMPPIIDPIANIAMVTVPGGNSGNTNVAVTKVNRAFLAVNKSVDKAFADVGNTLTYTLKLTNMGNVSANNVVINDAVPAGTSFVAGSLSGATGVPPTLTLVSPIAPGATATITYKVLIGNSVPVPNPITNFAVASYTYTVNPANPNGASDTNKSNTVTTFTAAAKLLITKTTDKTISYLGDTIMYQLAVTNSGNIAADNVIITDPIPNGTTYVPGSLTVNVPYTGTPDVGIALTNPVAAGETISISFQIKVMNIPNPNPIVNKAKVDYVYTVNPSQPDGVTASMISNQVTTVVFRYNYSQEISDLVESVALEQAALAAVINAEGAKVQKMVAMNNITPQELLCLNKSVSDMMDSLSTLEAILKQKLGVTECQINGLCV